MQSNSRSLAKSLPALALAALALAACGDSTLKNDDGGNVIERDLFTLPDLVTLPDLGPSPDLVTPPDLLPPPDLMPLPQPYEVQVLAFNDFHGNLAPPSGSSARVLAAAGDPQAADLGTESAPDAGTQNVNAGGAAYLAAHMATLKAQNPLTAIVHAGDFVGASPFASAVFHDEGSIIMANTIGVDYASVGNHEFDHGLSELLRLQYGGCHPQDGCKGPPDGGTDVSFPGANFEYLAANVSPDAGKSKTILPAYAIKHMGSEQVAFIGMTLKDTPNIVLSSGVAGLTFVDEVITVNKLVGQLKAQGVAAIVVVMHQGDVPPANTPYDGCGIKSGILWDIANGFDPAVDVVVSAHTHNAYVCDMMGKLVTSAASFGRLITQIKMTLDPVTHKVTAKSARQEIVTRVVTPDPAVKQLVDSYVAASAPVGDRVVGHLAVMQALKAPAPRSTESVMGDVIADAMLESAADPKNGGAVAAIMNPGGVRADITYAPVGGEKPGEITFNKCFTTQPFGNYLVTVSVTGAQIKTLLEQQFQVSGTLLLQNAGITYAYSKSAMAGSHVDPASIQVAGAPIDMNKTYRVVTDNFLQAGGDGFAEFKNSKSPQYGAVDVDALIAYFGKHDPFTPPTPNRVTVNP